MANISLETTLPSVYVIMGVSGVGKSTIGNAISQKLNGTFIEGDDFHSEENVRLMSSGQPLTDENRLPWLKELFSFAAIKRESGAVITACSALKRRHRDIIRNHIADVKFIHLIGSVDYIAKLMASREGHFMPLSLLSSQFDTLESLEPDEVGIKISIEGGLSNTLAKAEDFMSIDPTFTRSTGSLNK